MTEFYDEEDFFTDEYPQELITNITDVIPQKIWEELEEDIRNLIDNLEANWCDEESVNVIMDNPNWLARSFPKGEFWINRTKFQI